jgi:hypothetical protein
MCCLLLTSVGGARPRGGWRSLVIARLQGFSSCSPAAVPRQRSPRMMTVGLVVGKSEPGRGLSLALSFKDVHHPCWGGGRAELGPASVWAAARSFPQCSGEKGVRRPWRCQLPRVWLPGLSGSGAASSAASYRWGGAWQLVRRTGVGHAVRGPVASRSFPSRRLHRGSHNTSYAARAVFVFWDGLVLATVARTGVRTCQCARGRPPSAGVALARRWPLSSVLR